jgi:hypothetical protein
MDTVRHPDDPLHIAVCAQCRQVARADLGTVDLGRVWARVAADAWSSPTGRVEPLAVAVLRSPGLARALVTTPALIASWIGATVVVLLVGAIATRSTGEPWVALLAPALAGAGIAYAYGPGIDPAFELGRTMAVSDRTILLARSLTVFGLNALLGVAASLLTAAPTDLTWRWLVPMTTVSALGLAGATLSGSANTGVLTALAGWGMIVLARAVETRDLMAAVEPSTPLIPLYLAVAALGVAVSLYATSGQRLEKAPFRSTMV